MHWAETPGADGIEPDTAFALSCRSREASSKVHEGYVTPRGAAMLEVFKSLAGVRWSDRGGQSIDYHAQPTAVGAIRLGGRLLHNAVQMIPNAIQRLGHHLGIAYRLVE